MPLCNGTCLATYASGCPSKLPAATPYPFDDHEVTWDDEDCDQEYDSEEFEIIYHARRVDKVKQASEWSECIANHWPEIDLAWCIADWQDGILVFESQ